MSDEREQINAEVISVLPNKVKIIVNKLEDFELPSEKLKVGSYVRISDNEDAVMLAVIENYSIESVVNSNGEPGRKYVLEANPLGIVRDGEFERGGDTIAIPPKDVKPATLDDIKAIYDQSIEPTAKFEFANLSSNPEIAVPVNGNKFFNKHIAIVGSTGSGKSHTVAKIIQTATSIKEGEYEYTIYTSCCNATKGIFYYTTYDNRQITAVAMQKENLDSEQLICYPMKKQEQICYQN